ncbi:hypothetical protein WME73_25985 [Sorangium sp. So ce302]|uniref:hypothetical protein n=1 Tax=Sorangium sp. So ce302 TaxID=3133297 RepID=UPI003F606298
MSRCRERFLAGGDAVATHHACAHRRAVSAHVPGSQRVDVAFGSAGALDRFGSAVSP